jgi:hypothetical protein
MVCVTRPYKTVVRPRFWTKCTRSRSVGRCCKCCPIPGPYYFNSYQRAYPAMQQGSTKLVSASSSNTVVSATSSRVLTPLSKFEVDDAELEWTYPPVCPIPKDSDLRMTKLLTNPPQCHFDFIHFRSVVQGIQKWPQVLSEAYRCLKPGAYVELAEGDSKDAPPPFPAPSQSFFLTL